MRLMEASRLQRPSLQTGLLEEFGGGETFRVNHPVIVLGGVRRNIALKGGLPFPKLHQRATVITGERGAISDATNNAYRDSGLFHILSISGLHMVVMAGAVFFVKIGRAHV